MKTNLALTLALLLAACTSQNYELAYVNDENGKLDIFLFDSKNITDTLLISSENTKYNMVWSSDRKSLYYTEYKQGSRSIMRYNLESKENEELLSDTLTLTLNDVSKDGKTLLVSSGRDQVKGEIYSYHQPTKEWFRLTKNELYESGAKFSPDESQVIASIQTQAGDSIYRSGIAEIFQINVPNPINQKQLTSLKHFNALPDYSPNGEQIAFHHCDTGNCDIYVMNADGSNQVNITQGIDDNRWPRWSPDGRVLAFTKTLDGNSEIYIWNSSTKEITPLITSPKRDEIAEFRPKN